jgi:membrane dipeptidase
VASLAEGRASSEQRARALSVSRAAVELLSSSEVIDLHVDTFIWQRLFGYDLTREHGTGPFDARLFGQADLPRCIEAGLSGAVWIITTNPLRSRRGKQRAFFDNLRELTTTLSSSPDARVVDSARSYRAARAAGKHAAFIGIQGGNALEADLDDFDRPELANVTLITPVHMTRSRIGAPALPRVLNFGSPELTAFGADYIRKLNQRRILVDLAHISPEGFWSALSVHDKTLPLTVSHTGCSSLYPHFRNLDDAQLRAVAATGGVVGILVHGDYLYAGPRRQASVEHVAEHVLHALGTIGEDHVAFGSDFDGFIIPPRDLKSVLELPRLIDALLRRGVRETSIRKLLGQNFLRVLSALRP